MIQGPLGIAVVGAFFGIIALWTFYPPKGADPMQISTMLITLVGVMAAAASQVVQFYFGSSTGSSKKDDTINTFVKNEPVKPPVPPNPPAPPAQ